MKHQVRVAYVDTEGGPVPSAIGQIQGTPTIRAFIPKRSSARNEKQMLSYDSAREVGDLVRFATANMPNYVERVASEAEANAVAAKASRWGLPRVLVFSNKGPGASTSNLLKALSSEFRRRVLIVEVRKHPRTDAIATEHGVDTLPTLLCLNPTSSTPTNRFQGKDPTPGRLSTFVGKCALGKPVLSKPDADQGTKEEL